MNYSKLLEGLPSSSQNNSRELVLHYIKKYKETGNYYWARKIDNAIGYYPDKTGYTSPSSYEPRDRKDEIELIKEEIITNTNLMY